jgi:hypothetical protein
MATDHGHALCLKPSSHKIQKIAEITVHDEFG